MLSPDCAGIVNEQLVVATESGILMISGGKCGPQEQVSYGILGSVYCHKACSLSKVPWLVTFVSIKHFISQLEVVLLVGLTCNRWHRCSVSQSGAVHFITRCAAVMTRQES
jgi:hypothetical protein